MQANNDDELQGVIIDEVLEAEQLDDEGNFVLIVKSGCDIFGLVFSPTLAREAAVLLNTTADSIAGQ